MFPQSNACSLCNVCLSFSYFSSGFKGQDCGSNMPTMPGHYIPFNLMLGHYLHFFFKFTVLYQIMRSAMFP